MFLGGQSYSLRRTLLLWDVLFSYKSQRLDKKMTSIKIRLQFATVGLNKKILMLTTAIPDNGYTLYVVRRTIGYHSNS